MGQTSSPASEKTGKTAADLWKLYTDADSIDQEVFAEMRSNILLYCGDHYTRKSSPFYKRLRDMREVSNEQKLRLTKNHIQYICDTYVNNIVSANPGVGFTPKNDKEMHDQKVADIHHGVWRDAYQKYNIDDLIDDWADQFVQIGEVAVKVSYDTMKGPIKAYNQLQGDDGAPHFMQPDGTTGPDDGSALGMQNQPAPDPNSPVFKGEFIFEEIYGFNLLRPVECKDMRKAAWLGLRKMVATKDLEASFPDADTKILASNDQTYTVFDAAKGNYKQSKDEALVIEYYYRPCSEYPEGYFYITTKEGILAEGELPGGIFPIIVAPFRKFATLPRGRGPIKTLRPYQAEINRAASKMAEHQITLGDDKLVLVNGSKTSAGASLPGVRTMNVTGSAPVVMPGRDGSQYLGYMQSQIAEMLTVAMIREDTEELPAQLDPYSLLFRSARQKKRFQRNIKRFEKFLIQVVKTYLSLAKVHLPDDELIYAIGNSERINIPEFRALPDVNYEVKIEAQADDIETKLGKQLVLNNALQYVGSQLKPEDIGKIMRAMPYVNEDQSFDDMTIDFDASQNDMLALDRGQMPPVQPNENHVYMIKRLTARTKKGDFQFLSPQIQQAYQQKIQVHNQFEAQNQLAIQRAEQGLIPTGGYLAKCDLYTPDPTDPAKSQRVTLPSEALAWLIQHLQAQQSGLAPLMGLQSSMQAGVANAFNKFQSPSPTMGTPGPGMGPMQPPMMGNR